MNVKKIIAKEGLIFLCVFLAMVSIAIWSNPTEGNITILGYAFFPLVLGYVLYLMIRSLIIGNAVLPPTAKGRALKEVLFLGIPSIFMALSLLTMREFSTNQYLQAESRWQQIFYGIVLTFVISVLFYVVRFIIWAIKTLKQK